MPLLPAKCPNCGAALTLDPVSKAADCPFCNTPFIVEEAINNYTIINNYTTKVENLHADVVQ